MSLFRLTTYVVAALLCPIATAQYTAGKLIFKNPGTLNQKELEAAAGMRPGEKINAASIQAAAQRLIDTGYFEDVGATVEGPVASINVIFTLKPVDPAKLTATGFENFIWLTPEELTATLGKAAPLFHGRLPDAGNQADILQSALQSALKEKGVSATVTHETLEPSINQPTRVIEFQVDPPTIRVHSIALQGVSAEMAGPESKLTEKLRGSRYNEGLHSGNTLDELLGPYRDAGYLEAKFIGLRRTVAQSTSTEVSVDITGSIDAGQPYHVSAFNFSGTP